MKNLLLLLIMFPTIVRGQYEFRAIKDTSIICYESIRPKAHILNPLYDDAFSKYELFYITEEMPEPKTPTEDFEKVLAQAIRVSNEEKKYKGTVHIQCVINCRGEAGDYQVIYCPAELDKIEGQLLNVFRKRFIAWNSGMQGDKAVDVLIRILVMVNEGKFKVVAPAH